LLIHNEKVNEKVSQKLIEEIKYEIGKIEQQELQGIDQREERIRYYEKYCTEKAFQKRYDVLLNEEYLMEWWVNPFGNLLRIIGGICFLIGFGAVMERRGRSPWSVLWCVFPCIGWIILIWLYCHPKPFKLETLI
jgi:hypothetical protein